MRARDVTNEQLNTMFWKDPAAHSAWLDSMDEDEDMVVHTPVGWRAQLIIVAVTKNLLLTCPMPDSERLKHLESLERISAAGYTTAAQVAATAPASEALMRMVLEASKLDDPDAKAGRACMDFLTSWEVFWQILNVEPTLLDVMRMHPAASRQKAAPTVSGPH